jgi:hypothetical protein
LRVKRVLTGFVIGCAGLYGLMLAGLTLKQRELLYQAAPDRAVALHAGQSLVMLPGAGAALWAPPPDAQAPVVLHLHGNGEQLADLTWFADAVQQAGLGFLAPEYPGYGPRQGLPELPDEASLCGAGRAAVAYLRAQRVDAARTVLVGHSLGTGVAVQLATEGAGARLVLISAYTSITAMAQRTAPFAPVRLLLRDRYDSASKAAGVALPVLLLHGTQDPLIPVEMGRALAGAFPHATLLEIKNGHHGDLFAVAPGALGAALDFARTGSTAKATESR